MRLLVVGGHTVFRECLALRLGALGRFAAVDQAAPHGAVQAAVEGVPDAVLVDCSKPDETTVGLVLRLRRAAADVKVILLGVSGLEEQAVRCVEAGAAGCVSKEATVDELCAAVEETLQGGAPCSPRVAYSLYARLAELARERRRSERMEALELTPREMEILGLLAEGLSNRTIAERLALSVYTVKNHVHHILEKLEVDDRSQAVEEAYARRWLKERRSWT